MGGRCRRWRKLCVGRLQRHHFSELRQPGCRSGGATNAYTLVYTLGGNLAAAGTATVTQGTASVGTPTVGPNTNQVTVPLTAVANAQHLVITLNGVQDGTGAILNNLVARMD